MARAPVLEHRAEGLYCPAGDFHIDPWRPVDRAVVTHAHSDHARWGSRRVLCAQEGLEVMRARLGEDTSIRGLPYGRTVRIGESTVSLHPAGHILGSAQIRIEVDGEVWVVSGDYKVEAEGTCTPWEPVRCHGFVTETTFGLPVYRWRPQAEVFDEVRRWWAANRERGQASLLCAYALGKAQRLSFGLADVPQVVHGAVAVMHRACQASGLELPPWRLVSEWSGPWSEPLILCPPSAVGTPWARRFGEASVAFASGWMAIRGVRRRRNVDRGFVVSDHVDWPSLLSAVRETGAETVWTTHGYAHQVARYLVESGLEARALDTQFVGETEDPVEVGDA